MIYYYKKTSDTYHWHRNCSHVPNNVHNNPEWVVTTTRPAGREKCNECKAIDQHRAAYAQ